MPVSDPSNITPIVNEIKRLNPGSVLDLGVGVGKYGVLCREYLDIERGRIAKENWKTIICGVEGFEPYRNPAWGMYTMVEVDDFSLPENLVRYEGFDLVLMVDSLEHLEYRQGMGVLAALLSQNKHLIVSCPYGPCYLQQGAVNGNEFERHRHHWTPEYFERIGATIIHRGVCFVATMKGLEQK